MKKIFTLVLMAFVAVGAYAQEKTIFLGSHTLNWDYTPLSYNQFQQDDIIRTEGTLSGDNNQITLRANQDAISTTFSKAKNAYQLTSANAAALNTGKLDIYGTGYINTKVSIISKQSIVSTSLPFDESSSAEATNKLEFNCEKIKNLTTGDIIGFVLDRNASNTGWAQIRIQGQSGDGWIWKDFIDFTSVYQESVYEYTVQESDIDFFSAPKAFWAIGRYIKVIDVYILKGSEKDTYVLSSSDNDVTVANIPTSGSYNVEFNRSFAAGWNSICLPFNANVSSIDASAELYELTGGDNTKIVVTKKEDGAMVAGTPYLVNMNSAKSDNTTFSDVTVSATSPGNTSFGGIVFYGNYTKEMDMENKYGIAYSSTNSRWEIMKGKTMSTLPAFCAYFTGIPAPANSRGIGIEIGDGTTNINAFEVEEVEEAGPIYNLMGQQTTTPRKGIYIKNGKKYIAK